MSQQTAAETTTRTAPSKDELIKYGALQARIFCRKKKLPSQDFEDAEQEAVLEALTKAPRYAPERGEWRPFLYKTILNKLKLWYHNRQMIHPGYSNRWEGYPRVHSLKTDVPWHDQPVTSEAESPTEALARLLRLAPLIKNSLDRAVYVHLLAGENEREIAAKFGVSFQRINARKKRAFAVIRPHLQETA